MGTNYYAKINKCKECGNSEQIHLGKSSVGWTFSFQYNGGKYYKNIKQMKEWLKDKVIIDEYGGSIDSKKFFSMVEKKQKENKKHAESYKSKSDFIIGGYSFTDREFS